MKDDPKLKVISRLMEFLLRITEEDVRKDFWDIWQEYMRCLGMDDTEITEVFDYLHGRGVL